MTGNVRNRITIKEKADILDKIEGGAKKSDLAEQYKIAPSTVTAICNNTQKIRADLARSSNDTNKTVQTRKQLLSPDWRPKGNRAIQCPVLNSNKKRFSSTMNWRETSPSKCVSFIVRITGIY